jgi:hypothetical protein
MGGIQGLLLLLGLLGAAAGQDCTIARQREMQVTL